MEGFTQEQRRIFRYHDGRDYVDGDPLRLRATLNLNAYRKQRQINQLIRETKAVETETGTPEEIAVGWEAVLILAQIVRETFELKPEATDDHAIALIDYFHGWLKKNCSMPDNPSTSTAPAASISETQPTTATSSA